MEMNEAAFNKMHDILVTEHGNLKIELESSKKDNVFLFFGISRAGKSTLLARLLSSKDPDAFLQELPQPTNLTDGNMVKIVNGVPIGSGLNSTTILPKYYFAGGLDIYDMPGLNDADHSKKAAISILYKYLFSKLDNVKLIIVLNIDLIRNASTLMGSYHNELFELFGSANYQTYLLSTFFVLTNNDVYNFTEEQITNHITQALVGAARLPNNASAFVGRLLTNHAVVDYRIETGVKISEKLIKLAQQITIPIKARSFIENTDRFDIQGTIINNACKTRVSTLEESFETKVDEKFEVFKKQTSADYLKLKSELNGLIVTIKTLEAELLSNETSKRNCESLIERNNADLVRLTQDMTETNELLISYKTQETNYQQELSKVVFMRKLSFMSSESTSVTGKVIHKIRMRIRDPADAFNTPVIIITNDESSFNAGYPFHSNFDDNKFGTMINPYILYNSRLNLNPLGVKCEPLAEVGLKGSTITASSNTPFVLNYFYLAKLVDVDGMSVFRDFFERNISNTEIKIAQLAERISNIEVSTTNCHNDIKSLSTTIPKNKSDIELNKVRLSEKQQSTVQFLTTTLSGYDNLLREIDIDFRKSSIFQKLSAIGLILTESQIGNDILGGFADLSKKVDEKESEIKLAKTNFQKNMTELMSSTFVDNSPAKSPLK